MIIANHSLDMDTDNLEQAVIDALMMIILNTTEGTTKINWNFEDICENIGLFFNSYKLTPRQMKQALAIAIYYMHDDGMKWFVDTFDPEFNPWPEENENRFYCFDDM